MPIKKPIKKTVNTNTTTTAKEEKNMKRPAPKKIGKPNTKKAAVVDTDEDEIEDEEVETVKPAVKKPTLKKPTLKKKVEEPEPEEDDEDELDEEEEIEDEDELDEDEAEDEEDESDDDSDEDENDESDDDEDESDDEPEEDEDDEPEEDEPVKKTKKSKAAPKKAPAKKAAPKKAPAKKEKDEEEDSSYDKEEIVKGTRMCVPKAEDFSSSSRKMPGEVFFKNLYSALEECEVVELPEDVKKIADKVAVASQVYMAIQKAFIKTLVTDNSAVPFLNAKIFGKEKEGRVFPIIPGGPAKRETYQPPMISFVLTGNNFLEGEGLLYEYNTISEASAAGSRDGDTFRVEVDSVGDNPLWKKGDVIDIATGKKVTKKAKDTGKKPVKKAKKK